MNERQVEGNPVLFLDTKEEDMHCCEKDGCNSSSSLAVSGALLTSLLAALWL